MTLGELMRSFEPQRPPLSIGDDLYLEIMLNVQRAMKHEFTIRKRIPSSLLATSECEIIWCLPFSKNALQELS